MKVPAIFEPNLRGRGIVDDVEVAPRGGPTPVAKPQNALLLVGDALPDGGEGRHARHPADPVYSSVVDAPDHPPRASEKGRDIEDGPGHPGSEGHASLVVVPVGHSRSDRRLRTRD